MREDIEAAPIKGEVELDEAPEERERAEDAIGGSVFPKAQAQATAETDKLGTAREMKRTRSRQRRKIVKKKRKPSIFQQVKNFLLRSIDRLFG